MSNRWRFYWDAFCRGFWNGAHDKRAIAAGVVLGCVLIWWMP